MTHPLYPCLWFDGKAKEAADFYCAAFSNSKITHDNPVVVNFELDGCTIMGLNGGPVFKPNPSISLFVMCETDEEINSLWAKLTEGGFIMMPLDKYDWSERYGFFQDKFGVSWQLMKGTYSSVNQKITSCFLFVGGSYGKAEAAVNYYTKVFPASSISGIKLYEESEGAEMAGKVKHSQFILNNTVFMAMDGFGQHEFAFSEGVSLVVNCDTQDEIDYYWNTLTSDGGAESMCGWLKDKFGVSWQIVPSMIGELMSDPEKGQRVMQEVLKMRKINIGTLVKA